MREGVLDWLYGVMVRPADTLRAVAEAEPVGWALAVVAGTWVLSLASGLASADLGAIERLGFQGAATLVLRSVLPLVIIVFALAYLVALATLHFAARLFGGKGTFSAFFCATGFASFPAVLALPIAALRRVAGPGIEVVSSLASVGLALWVIVLGVIALREAHELPTGTAIGAYVLAMAVPVILLGGAILLIAIMAGAFGAALLGMAP